MWGNVNFKKEKKAITSIEIKSDTKIKKYNYLKPKTSLASNEEVEVWDVEGFLVKDLNKVRSGIVQIQKQK